MESNGLTQLTVYGVVTDPNTETQIVILRNERTAQILPIWVGAAEGNAIKLALDEAPTPRPMSHDLLRSLVEHLNLTVARVVITDVKSNTYFATIHLASQGAERTVNARPSDAIALALRAGSPIFVTADVLQQRGGNSLDAWLEKLGAKNIGTHGG
ncbi:MAG: bifunctional nuclease family protein [Nitrospira sp.]|nr:bifunctional nuclease family protein [Nitrospira sp.]